MTEPCNCWRESPEWADLERALSNLVALDPDAQGPMVTDFVVVAATVPGNLDAGNLLGANLIFSSSPHPYITKGLLVDGLDIQRSTESDNYDPETDG